MTILDKSIYKNKDFILLFLGGFVSRIGNSIHFVALTWYVLELTGSGGATGMIMFLSTLPGVIIGPFAGVLADRISRKVIIVAMDIVRGLVVLWLSWYIYLGTAEYFHLSVATVLLAVCGSFFNPAVSATLPNLVKDENLQKANSMEHFSQNFTAVIGAALGGILISIFGISGIFLINGTTFLISALSELFINIPVIKKEKEEDYVESAKYTIFNDLKFGAKFLYNNKGIFSIFMVALVLNFIASGSLMVGVPYIFKEILQVSGKLYGIAQSVFPAGAFIGAILLNFLPEIKNFYRVFYLTIGFEGILFFVVGIPLLPVILNNFTFLVVYYIILVILLTAGIINAFVNVPIMVILQRAIPDNLRGRVFGLLSSLSQGLVPISMAVIGILIDFIPLYYILMVSGFLTFLMAVLITRIKYLHIFKDSNESKKEKPVIA